MSSYSFPSQQKASAHHQVQSSCLSFLIFVFNEAALPLCADCTKKTVNEHSELPKIIFRQLPILLVFHATNTALVGILRYPHRLSDAPGLA
jgi:hypothetical protein